MPSCKVFASVLASYCVMGAVFNARRGARGRELVPHQGFWAETAALIGIGCAFTFSKAKKVTGHLSASAQYENL